MKFLIKDFFGKCDQIRSFLRIWLHLVKKSLIENAIFCAVNVMGPANSAVVCCYNSTKKLKKVQRI